MNIFLLPQEIIAEIYQFDNTFYKKYELCIVELNKFKKSYPRKKTRIHFNFDCYSVIGVEHMIADEDIKDYNKHIFSLLYPNKYPNKLKEHTITDKIIKDYNKHIFSLLYPN